MLHNKHVIVRSAQRKSVNIVYGGNRERMLEMVFDNQEIQGKEGDEKTAGNRAMGTGYL